MKAPRLASLILVLFAGSVGDQLFAQEQPAIAPGARVRVWAPSFDVKKVVGGVSALKADTLVMTVPDQEASLELPLAAVTKLEVSQGTKSWDTRAILLGAAGSAVSLAGLTAALICLAQESGCSLAGSEEALLIIAAGGAVIGGVLGGLQKVERWGDGARGPDSREPDTTARTAGSFCEVRFLAPRRAL